MSIAARGLVVGRSGFRTGPYDFAAPPGAVVALVGPNGGGKSTLLRTLAGLLPPLSGAVDHPVSSSPALLPPPGELDPPFAAAHVVALGRAVRARWSPILGEDDRRAARDALVVLGIGHLADRPFDRLSSGQRQLVLMARLVVQDARLCLLDEPTAMLDPAQAAKVEYAIRTLVRDGRTLVLATHDIGLARRADIAVTVGPEPAAGPPAALLTDGRVSALYGADLSACPTCGQAVAGRTRA